MRRPLFTIHPRERVRIWLAWRLPRSVAYWAMVRVVTSDYDGDPTERSVVEALERWGTPS